MSVFSSWGAALGGLFLAAGVAGAGMFVGESLVEMRRAERVVTVKGLAEKAVRADLAFWRIPFRATGETNTAAIKAASKAQATILAFAQEGGLGEDEIIPEPFTLRIERMFLNGPAGEQREVERFIAVGAVRLRSENIDVITKLSGGSQALLDAGVFLGDSDYGEATRPQYLFTGLNAIKPELIAAATKNARASANQFAKDSDSELGGIASANQGVVRILPRDGGFDERLEQEKIVRVVSTISYYLED